MGRCIEIRKGKPLIEVLRWGTSPFVYSAISAITQTAPVQISAAGHGLPDGWPVAVVSVKGMRQINAESSPPSLSRDYRPATVVDDNTVQINEINAADFSAYTSGGYLQYHTPVDLTGYTARLVIKDRIGGTELLRLTGTRGITLDNTAKTITYAVAASVTEKLTWKKGVFELEMEASDGTVTTLDSGEIVVFDEVATS